MDTAICLDCLMLKSSPNALRQGETRSAGDDYWREALSGLPSES